MEIRQATAGDLAECQAIYAHHVLEGTGTFEEVPPPLETITRRYEDIVRSGWAWLIASDVSGVLGFAYYTQFRPRSAYRFTAEDSVYVRDDVRGQGVGKALVAALISHAEQGGFRQMLAVVGDSENIGSIGVHSSLGFQRVGMLRDVGFKFGNWIDLVFMQRSLTPTTTRAPTTRD